MFDADTVVPGPAPPVPPVLGIDPGVTMCGYGAVARTGAAVQAVVCGVLHTDRDQALPERLAHLEADLEALVGEVRPAAVAVERVLFQANTRTAISVGQASGLALAVAARAGVPVVQYSPNEVKLAVAGDGRANKGQVQRMVARLLGLAEPVPPPDAADALALALCHLWCDRLAGSLAAATADTGGLGSGGTSPRLAARVEAALTRTARSGGDA